MNNPSHTVYFPNLNGVRFIAAFSVLIHHIEQVKEVFKVPNFYDNHLIKNMGKLGVDLFFVLSGFLITYLLLHEKGRFGRINTRDFYIRRILRIWPLYFLIVLLAFFVFPHIPLFVPPNNEISFMAHNFYERLSLFLLVLPNVGFILYNSPYLAAQTWSIGVEEQFYYLWPWIVKNFNWKRLLITVLVFSGGTFAVFWFYYSIIGNTQYANNVPEIVRFFFSQFRILTLMTGGGCAMLVYYRKEAVLKYLFLPQVQVLVYMVLLICLATGFHVPSFNLEFYGLFFGFFILNLSSNPRSLVNLEYRWISYLGKISYGIYIYQTAMIVASVHLIHQCVGEGLSHWAFNLLLYPLAILLTVSVSAISYSYFEKPFLRLKERFSPH
ncbi:MAG: acyltransferase family protein [Runella sp.]